LPVIGWIVKVSEKIKNAIESFGGINWCSCGDPCPHEEDPKVINPGWVKFEIEKTERGWRILEFLAWLTTDMIRAGERIEFFPTSPPPYLNDPGKCLSFVIEIHPKDGDEDERFSRVASFIKECREKYWDQCKI
jgi:hypothetical protein